ncbi:unnamed protein product [Ilex paraguariensis]|uniref:Uncharacterized protein n=1 Tax=Ilex paraguariensis TaxID=185542 RepID=A0ABC8RIL8_9AQUA
MTIAMFFPDFELGLLAEYQDESLSSFRVHAIYLAVRDGFIFHMEKVADKENSRLAGNVSDSEAYKNSQPSPVLTVSSNFEHTLAETHVGAIAMRLLCLPRRSRSTSPSFLPTSSSIVFRPDAIFGLLRKAYKDSHLGAVCRLASRILLKLIEPITVQKPYIPSPDVTSSVSEEASRSEPSNNFLVVDYSNLFGDEFRIADDHWDSKYLNLLDVGAVEEGVLHVLYACASQPLLCSKLADSTSDFWSALPLVQALLPVFSRWRQPFVQEALSQIVATSCSSVYHPLLHACAGYLSSFSPSHAKAACVLIDLCSGVLAPWMAQVIAKVDLTVELLEDLLGVIQDARHSLARARAALKYIVLALSGHMDDVMTKYKDVKHRLLFLVEMLEPFIDPAITRMQSMIAFGNVSSVFLEKQEHICTIALNVIRMAVKKSAVLPSLEAEWRNGSVAPSVLLSILDPQMQLPPDIDLCKISGSEPLDPQLSTVSPFSSVIRYGGASSKSKIQDDADGKTDNSTAKMDSADDVSYLFAPPELRSLTLTNFSGSPDVKSYDMGHCNASTEENHVDEKKMTNQFHNFVVPDAGYAVEYSKLHADLLQLMNYRDSELRASEFRRLALELHSQNEITPDGHDAAIDALLLAAECYINPFFIMSFKNTPKVINNKNICRTDEKFGFADLKKVLEKNGNEMEAVAHLERRRDNVVLQILLEAAELDRKYRKTVSDGQLSVPYAEGNEGVQNISLHDIQSADAITLVRQNQALLCNFLIQHLQREQHSMHEILMQSLLFLLQSATKLFCAPEHVVDIILESAEYFSELLTSLYYQSKEGNLQINPGKLHEIQRRWMLLQRLVIASSGGGEGPELGIDNKYGFQFANLIPPSAWMQKIPSFSSSASPLVRFLGWMAVARNAKQYQKERLFLASDLLELTYLLSIFADELALVDNITKQKDENKKIEQSGFKQDFSTEKGFEHPGQQYGDQSFRAIYPDISQFFPNMKKQFEAFGEIILEAVGLQLRSLSSNVLPDLLCWFSDLCSWPFVRKEKVQLSTQNNSNYFRGFVAKNAKAIILYVLEAIVIEHMEAMVPEIPRVVQVLVSLSTTSYCDVSFLDSVLQLLKPIISFSLRKVSGEENLLTDDSCLNFESLCFDELFRNIRQCTGNGGNPAEKVYNRALTIFILASVFPDLSFHRKREILQALIFWADFATFEPTTTFYDYLSAFQSVTETCKVLLVETLRVWGAIPLKLPSYSDSCTGTPYNDSSESHLWFLHDVCQSAYPTEASEKLKSENGFDVVLDQKVCQLSVEEIGNLSKDLEGLISKLIPTIELCWKIHHQLAKTLTLTSTECFMYSRCLSSIAQKVLIFTGVEKVNVLPSDSVVEFPVHWSSSLEGLAEMILALQENHCWEVASVMLDCLLGVTQCFCLDNVIGAACSAIKNFSGSAPKIAWRLQTDKWLSVLFARHIHNLHETEVPLLNLFSSLLGHPEPEQRFIALKHLGKLVGQDVDAGAGLLFSASCNRLTSPDFVTSVSELILSPLVSSTWDQVAVLASSDTSLLLRTCATALLINYVPFAERRERQSLLAAADRVLQGLTKLAHPMPEGSLTQISLALIASVCLYSPADDISLIPENVWRDIETLGMSETDGNCGNLEKKACHALCRLKIEGDEAKEILKEVLCSSYSKHEDPAFTSTRDSILQVW